MNERLTLVEFRTENAEFTEKFPTEGTGEFSHGAHGERGGIFARRTRRIKIISHGEHGGIKIISHGEIRCNVERRVRSSRKILSR